MPFPLVCYNLIIVWYASVGSAGAVAPPPHTIHPDIWAAFAAPSWPNISTLRLVTHQPELTDTLLPWDVASRASTR